MFAGLAPKQCAPLNKRRSHGDSTVDAACSGSQSARHVPKDSVHRATGVSGSASEPLASSADVKGTVDFAFLQTCGNFGRTELPWEQQNRELEKLLHQLGRQMRDKVDVKETVLALVPALNATRSGTQVAALKCTRVCQAEPSSCAITCGSIQY
jgi:hypothetical protein